MERCLDTRKKNTLNGAKIFNGMAFWNINGEGFRSFAFLI